MAGNLLNKARLDAQKFLTSGGFENDITLTSPDGLNVLNTTGLSSNHWITFATDGSDVDSKNVHVSVSENTLIAANYPYRNSSGEIHLYRHKVNVAHNDGVVRNYIVQQWHPSQSLGVIVLVLSDFENI